MKERFSHASSAAGTSKKHSPHQSCPEGRHGVRLPTGDDADGQVCGLGAHTRASSPTGRSQSTMV